MQQSLHILQVPALELSQLIRAELTSNPVLEEETEENENDGEVKTEDEQDAEADEKLDAEFEQLAKLDEEWRDYFNQTNAPVRATAEEDKLRQTFFESVASPQTLQEHLLSQLHLSEVDDKLRPHCEMIIGNIEDNGFLGATPDEIKSWDVPSGSFDRALKLIQSFDPIGVAARDLRECLLLQLLRLGHKEGSLAYRMVSEHINDLAARHYAEISESLGATLDNVHQTAGLIATLDPRPGSRFTTDESTYVTPDLNIQKVGEDWVVIPNDDWLPSIRISNTYKDILGTKQETEVKSYVRERLRAAKFFIKSIQQRQQTVLKIAREIVQVQLDFFEHGRGYLKPLTMTEVAHKIGVHETTVSRAIANKYMQTPHGLFEMKYFFTPGLRTSDGGSITQEQVKGAIAELVSGEAADKPLADQDIMKALQAKGITIARRTVAKYREELSILPSHMRRSK